MKTNFSVLAGYRFGKEFREYREGIAIWVISILTSPIYNTHVSHETNPAINVAMRWSDSLCFFKVWK